MTMRIPLCTNFNLAPSLVFSTSLTGMHFSESVRISLGTFFSTIFTPPDFSFFFSPAFSGNESNTLCTVCPLDGKIIVFGTSSSVLCCRNLHTQSKQMYLQRGCSLRGNAHSLALKMCAQSRCLCARRFARQERVINWRSEQTLDRPSRGLLGWDLTRQCYSMRGYTLIVRILIVLLHCGVLASHSVAIDASPASEENHDTRLPAFIIAGTQKSGTTALAALLSEHPRVQLSRRKEVHYFDKVDNYNKGTDWYLAAFPGANSTTDVTIDKVDSILGDATPFYVASRKACKRISDTIPGAKVIILLREPVARAYSEFQMKHRRMIAQEEFLRLANLYEADLYGCMIENADNFSAISACVPKALSQHSRYSKLVTAWRKALEATKHWHSVIDTCFPWVSTRSRLQDRQVWNECDVSGNCDDSTAFEGTGTIHHHLTAVNISSSSNQKDLYARNLLSAPPAFNATSCWTYYKPGLETVKSLKDAMMGEITAFRRCRVTFQHSVDVKHLTSPCTVHFFVIATNHAPRHV